MACSGTDPEIINLTPIVSPGDLSKIFSALKKGNNVPQEPLEKILLSMLRAVQDNEASVAPVNVSDNARIEKVSATPFFWPCKLEGTKPWVVYSNGCIETSEFCICIYYSKSESSMEEFRVVLGECKYRRKAISDDIYKLLP